jgi:hypothetical protein
MCAISLLLVGRAQGQHRVLREFLAEATLMGLIGGVVGYLLGLVLTSLLDAAGRGTNFELFLVTPTLTALAIGFAIALGAVAGVIPALRAARMAPPIRALKCSAIAPMVVSAKMPITIPRIVSPLRSRRRPMFRRISMLDTHLQPDGRP